MDVFLFSSSSSFLYDHVNYGSNLSKFAELLINQDAVKETCLNPAATFAATASEAAGVDLVVNVEALDTQSVSQSAGIVKSYFSQRDRLKFSWFIKPTENSSLLLLSLFRIFVHFFLFVWWFVCFFVFPCSLEYFQRLFALITALPVLLHADLLLVVIEPACSETVNFTRGN